MRSLTWLSSPEGRKRGSLACCVTSGGLQLPCFEMPGGELLRDRARLAKRPCSFTLRARDADTVEGGIEFRAIFSHIQAFAAASDERNAAFA